MSAAHLQSYLTRWKLSGAELIATTATSNVYAVSCQNRKAVLKLLSDLGEKDESGAVAALTCFDGKGAVKLLQHDKGAHLLEYADGEDLKAVVARGDDDRATQIIGDVLNQLHAAAPAQEGLKPLTAWFRSLFMHAQTAGADPVYRRAAITAEKLLAQNDEPRVLHGDIHHENIRHSSRGWLALDPKGLYGPRLYDAANTFFNPTGMESLTQDEGRLLAIADILARKLQTTRSRLLTWVFAYGALSASWSVEDGQSPDHALAVARLAGAHIEGFT